VNVSVLQAFLDERGGDFDDCTSFEQLVSGQPPRAVCMRYVGLGAIMFLVNEQQQDWFS
jgi:hypothetical protein